ncbi:MAG: type II toxin-antitoxin system VapC family toxin [Acidobacteriota bacterium]
MILLDTHVLIWLDNGQPIKAPALAAIETARSEGGVLVSPVSAWEIGTLVRKRRLSLAPDPLSWIKRFLSQPGVRSVELTIDAAALSAALTEPVHGDPADRLLVATARELGVALATRDERILDYAAQTQSVEVLAC